MSAPRSPRPRHGARLWRRVRTLSPWSLVVIAVVFAFTFGLQAWPVVIAVVLLLIGAVRNAGSRRLEELFERKPDLWLRDRGDEAGEGRLVALALPPWPVDVDRIVAHDLDRLRDEATAYERLFRSTPAFRLAFGPVGLRPGAEEYEQAREAFTERLRSYAQAAFPRSRATRSSRSFRHTATCSARSATAASDQPRGTRTCTTLPAGTRTTCRARTDGNPQSISARRQR
jgi:hypothetical protein